MAAGVVEEKIGVVVEAADDAGAGGDVGEEEAPCGDGTERMRERHLDVGVERAGGCGVARVVGDADGDEENRGGGEEVGEPGSVAGESANQGDRDNWRGCGRDC